MEEDLMERAAMESILFNVKKIIKKETDGRPHTHTYISLIFYLDQLHTSKRLK